MIYTLEELLSRGDEYSKKLEEKIRFSKEVKSKVRHKVVANYDDFCDKDKAFLQRLKEQIFDGNDIYVFGSRINGTYLSDEEYEMYKESIGMTNGVIGTSEVSSRQRQRNLKVIKLITLLEPTE